MSDPLTALILGAAAAAGLALLFWPQGGVLARWKKRSRNSLRVQVEDALKHLYECEYRKVSCTLESIAGALSISVDHAATLTERLEAMNLLGHTGVHLTLTPDGRSYALRIIRVHRLWERYLSDETNVEETQWHAKAERQEHLLTQEQADELARRLGNPLYDPHGDPIPTPAGKIPPYHGKPLTSLSVGDVAGIIHIEDEPSVVYAQLVAQGLLPGIHVRVLDRSPERIVLEAQGNELVLAPVVAANVTVAPLAAGETATRRFPTLADLEPGERAIVAGISPACRGLQRRRLMDLGVVPGTSVGAEMRSAAGDPTAYRICGALVALRKQLAELIFVRREQVEEDGTT